MGKRLLVLSLSPTSKIYLYDWLFSSMSLSLEGTIIQTLECEKPPNFTMWLRTPGILTFVLHFSDVPREHICICRTANGGAANLPIAVDRGHMITVGSRSEVFTIFLFIIVCSCSLSSTPLIRLFFMSGWPNFSNTPNSNIYEYTPATDTWTTKSATIPTGLPHHYGSLLL